MERSIEFAEFPYSVMIPWTPRMDNVMRWNEVCAQAMEVFGLPGDRYLTQANINHMTWYFKTEQEALLMRLKFSELI
jgi:hypothetical protein